MDIKICLLDCGGGQHFCLLPCCLLLFLTYLICGQGVLDPLPHEWPPTGPWTEQALMAFSPLGAAGFVSILFKIKINVQSFLDVSPTTRVRRRQVFLAPAPSLVSFPPSESHLCVLGFPLGPGLSFVDSPTGTLASSPICLQLLSLLSKVSELLLHLLCWCSWHQENAPSPSHFLPPCLPPLLPPSSCLWLD